MEYPDHKTYALLYARFFRKDRFLALFEGLEFKDKLVLDLCCGAGQVSLEAMNRGARTGIAVDKSFEMISEELHDCKEVGVEYSSVEDSSVSSWSYQPVDIAICQQGINYWLTRETAERLAEIMAPDGIFVFNTFANRPSETPKTISYELEGRRYFECSYLIHDLVYHIQVCEGIKPHMTVFKWLSWDTIESIMDGLFDVRAEANEANGASVIYRCRKSS